MNEQDRRAVESLCVCGLEFDAICKSFPDFSIEEISRIYIEIHSDDENIKNIVDLKMNCS